MNRELSTGCELSTASLKKREGEKRNPPLTPYREKGKGKEQSQVSYETSSKPARAYARVAYAYFKRRGWRKTGLPRRTFFHALKKVKVFLYACKQRAKPTSAWCRGRKPLH